MSNHRILTSEDHRDLRVRTESGAELGDAVMCCITVPAEFRQVQADFPILFRLDHERDVFMALAMFGFENGENLFLDGERWDAGYRPLAIDVQPFLIGQPDDASGARQVHIDVASPRIGSGQGVRLFDQDGRSTPFLETMAEKLGALDAGYQASADFFAALRRYQLLEPLTLEVTLDNGSTNRLVGFHVIDEDKLRQIEPAVLAELHGQGHLMPIFMAIASLAQLAKLIARKNRRSAHG
jgi:hypothetical protein